MIATVSLRLLHPIFQWVLGTILYMGPVGSRDAVAIVAPGVSKPTVIGW